MCPSGLAFVDAPRGDLNHDGTVGDYSSTQWAKFPQYESWPTIDDATAITAVTASSKLPASKNEAHFYAECSGKGACDRDTGLCQCFDGYTGSACQRTVCPNDCSGHGLCRSVKDIAAGALNKRFLDSAGGYNMFSGVSSAFEYRLWDADKNMACVCDAGYSGVDCSLRECPRGDDPLTNIAATCSGKACLNEVQAFTIMGGSNSGSTYRAVFTDFSGAKYTSAPFTVTGGSDSDNAASLKNALETLPNNVTGIVSVSSAAAAYSSASPKDVRLAVTFTTLSGNVPAMTIERSGSTVDAVTQPAQRVQVADFSGVTGTASTVQVWVYPKNTASYRPAQLTATASVSTTIPAAIKSAFASISALSTRKAVDVQTTGTKAWMFMPDEEFGATNVRIVVTNSASTKFSLAVTADARDGVTEHSICSNRGLCDYSSGICACFPGYTGAACNMQNALAM